MGRMLEKIQKIVATWKFNRVKWVKTLWIKKGIALAKAGKHQEAITYYNTALEIDPRHPMAWSFKGEALLELGKFQEAREAFQNFIKFAPPKYTKYVSEAKKIVQEIEAIMKKGQ